MCCHWWSPRYFAGWEPLIYYILPVSKNFNFSHRQSFLSLEPGVSFKNDLFHADKFLRFAIHMSHVRKGNKWRKFVGKFIFQTLIIIWNEKLIIFEGRSTLDLFTPQSDGMGKERGLPNEDPSAARGPGFHLENVCHPGRAGDPPGRAEDDVTRAFEAATAVNLKLESFQGRETLKAILRT